MSEISLNRNQRKFFDTLTKYETVVDCGDWRAGKSFELCLFAAERMKKYPGITEFMGRETLTSLKQTTFLKFQELLRDHYKLSEGRDYYVRRSSPINISFPNGSSCIFGDLKEVHKWLSAEYSDILIDQAEEISEYAFNKIISRQSQLIIQKQSKGKQTNKTVLVMNPPEIAEQHWTHDKFRNPETKIKKSIMIYSDIRNNLENVPDKYLDTMTDSIDSRTAMIYLGGGDKWIPLLSKLVYPDYEFPVKNGKYVEGGNLKYLSVEKNRENYIAIDFGWTHPMSIGCWQYNPYRHEFYRLYEVVENHVTPEKYCDLLEGKQVIINGKDYQLPITVYDSTIVPLVEATQKRQESAGKSNLIRMKEIFGQREIPFNYRISNVGIHSGIISVRSHIKTKSGTRKIFIDPRYCKRFIDDAKLYHYPTDISGNVTSEVPEKDDISDHTQDEARGLIGLLRPVRTRRDWSVEHA